MRLAASGSRETLRDWEKLRKEIVDGAPAHVITGLRKMSPFPPITEASATHPLQAIILVGGVARNQFLRKRLESISLASNIACIAPRPELCSDNAVMIGWAALEALAQRSSCNASESEPVEVRQLLHTMAKSNAAIDWFPKLPIGPTLNGLQLSHG